MTTFTPWLAHLCDGASGTQFQPLGIVLGAIVSEGNVGVGPPRVDILGGQHCRGQKKILYHIHVYRSVHMYT